MAGKAVSLCVVGPGGVGKSAMTIQFMNNTFVTEYDPTMEDLYSKEVEIDGRMRLLDIQDTAGQEEFRPVIEKFLKEAEGFLLVYSIVQRDTFESLSEVHSNILHLKDKTNSDAAVPMVLVGNKLDIADANGGRERKVSTAEGQALAKKFGNIPFFECSAKERTAVDEAFFTAVREVDRLAVVPDPQPAKQSGCPCTIS